MDLHEMIRRLTSMVIGENNIFTPEEIRGSVDLLEQRLQILKARSDSTIRCVACRTGIEAGSVITLDCRHYWCKDCLETRFSLSLRDETTYSPRCCWYIIPLKEVQKHLSQSLVREFRSRQLELNTQNKTYCHKPKCSAFIAPHSIHNGEAICQKCNGRTCAKCREQSHFGPCSAGEGAAFMEFAGLNDWKQCPTCRRMVSREDGCNIMMCRCGSEFCYDCGCDLGECECDLTADEGHEIDNDSTEEENNPYTTIEDHRRENHQDFRVISERGSQFHCSICERSFYNWINLCIRCDSYMCNLCRAGRVR